MGAAWLLTLLALAGVVAGARIGQARRLSWYLGAAGGGLLFGIALFWLIPEIAQSSGWVVAFAFTIVVCCVALLLDRLLAHTGHGPGHGVIGPLLAAAAVHSFLDGWSVRALSGQPLAHVAVPVGLAMHKIPEGLALGWITHKSLGSTSKAISASAAVEAMTLVGAFVEPRANQLGVTEFGTWWTAAILAIIAGGFLFLGLHALWPGWKRPSVVLLFLASLALVGILRP